VVSIDTAAARTPRLPGYPPSWRHGAGKVPQRKVTECCQGERRMDEDGKTILLWVAGGILVLFLLSTCTDMYRGKPRGTTFIEMLNRDNDM
jgi:hypothetical protein